MIDIITPSLESKVVEPTNKKRHYKTLWTSAIKSPISPLSLRNMALKIIIETAIIIVFQIISLVFIGLKG